MTPSAFTASNAPKNVGGFQLSVSLCCRGAKRRVETRLRAKQRAIIAMMTPLTSCAKSLVFARAALFAAKNARY
jgi:hypothetical protein